MKPDGITVRGMEYPSREAYQKRVFEMMAHADTADTEQLIDLANGITEAIYKREFPVYDLDITEAAYRFFLDRFYPYAPPQQRWRRWS